MWVYELTALDDRVLLVDNGHRFGSGRPMDSKLFELDGKMDGLRAKMASFPARITKDYQDRLDVSWTGAGGPRRTSYHLEVRPGP